jgi:WD domain, G-beta repeat
MQTLRIFISSPSDVQPERLYAERLIKRLSNEFSESVTLEAYFWEYEPMQLAEHELIFFGRTKAIGEVIGQLRRRAQQVDEELARKQSPGNLVENPSPGAKSKAGPDVESNQNSSATFLLVSATSGVGKSSLIRAGVLPLLLKDGVIEGVNLWRHAVFRPSDAVADLLDGLAQVLVKPETLPELAGEGVSAGDLAAQLRKYPTGLDIPIAQALFHAADLAMKDKDGRRILTASNDHTAQVWDRETGRPLIEALKLANMLTEARFSPDGALIITACIDGTARIWDAETEQPLTERFQHEDRVLAAEFSPDNRRIVTASTDKTARVWDFAPRPSKTHVWLPELVEVICRGTLTENGSFKGAEKAPALSALHQNKQP